MRHVSTVLGQLYSFIPRNRFREFAGQQKIHGNTKINCWQQLVLMLFAQAANVESLRHLQDVWLSRQNQWYHLGIESVAKSTLSDANKRTDSSVFERLFYEIVSQYREYIPKQKFSFDEDLYLLDGSIVSLIYSLFDWAKYRSKKGGIRLHTLYCATEQIPRWVNITNAKNPHEVSVAKQNWKSWELPEGCILCFDRGYLDYAWWYDLEQSGVFWITKGKSNTHFWPVKSYASDHPQVLLDEEGTFFRSEDKYPTKVRRIQWYDPKEDKILVFFTNHHDLAPEQIAEAHKARWQIELFFKWIKQHLKIKSFLGTTENAVKSQIWIALIYFIIVSYIKAKTKLKHSLFILTKVLAQALFEHVHIIELINLKPNKANKLIHDRASPQLKLC